MKQSTVAAFFAGAIFGAAGVAWWSHTKREPARPQDTAGAGSGSLLDTRRKEALPGASIFKSGPLSDSAWWETASKGGAARALALRQKAAEILAMPHLSQRRRLLGAMLESYEPGDWRAILDGLVEREKIGGRFDQEYEILMERAAETDGAVILGRIMKESGARGLPKFDWQKHCMANWAASDGTAAIAWWNGLPDGEFRDFLSAPLIEGMARDNIDEAWRAAQIFDPEEREKFAGDLAKSFASGKGPEAAAAWIAGLGEGQGKAQSAALGELSKFMHQTDFPQQGKLVGQFAGKPWAADSPAFNEVSRVWGQVDAPAAMTWAASLPAGQAREMALDQAMHQWALKDADASESWLADHPDQPETVMLRRRRNETLRMRGLVQGNGG